MGSSEKSIPHITEAIIKTLIYSDIFAYPLTREEIWKFLIAEKRIKRREFNREIKSLNSVVFKKNGFLYLEGKKVNIAKRERRYQESVKKIKLAKKIAEKLFQIPTVLFIGISGNLSMMAASSKDDIDFFIITQKDKTWITRLLMILFLKILGKHRGRRDKKICDKICLNMIVGENKLVLPKNSRNLYTAHEIAQLLPLLDRNNTYYKFIKSNKWVEEFLPNALRSLPKPEQGKTLFFLSFFLKFSLFEKTARFAQRILIKRNLTREIIEDNFIALHPKDYKGIIISRYRRNLLKYGFQT